MSSNQPYVPFDVVYVPDKTPKKKKNKKMIWVVGEGYVPEEDLIGK